VGRLREWAQRLKTEIVALWFCTRHPRTPLYAKVQDRLAEDAPWVPLAHTQVVYAARRDLDNVQMLATGHIVFSKVRRRH